MALCAKLKFLLSKRTRLSWNLRSVWDETPKDLDKGEEKKKLIKVPAKGLYDRRLLNGVPQEQLESRRVKIFRPSKNPMQSGTANTHQWEITFDTKQRWENYNMGWCSSGDPMSNVELKFLTKQEAIEFCKRNGWKWYETKKKDAKNARVKSYANNFSMDKRFRVSTK